MLKPPFKCPLCKRVYTKKESLYAHIEREHPEDLVNGMGPAQLVFNYRNRYPLTKMNGLCVISGKPTKFNNATERYERFYSDKEKELYSKYFKDRMVKKYGKPHLMNDIDHQHKLLASRHISGAMEFADGTKLTYVGSYEKKFLEHLSNMGFNGSDICAPCPIVAPYVYDGAEHVYIPDFYIGSVDLIVEIKASDNNGYRQRDIERERAKDDAIQKTAHKFLKVFDNNFEELDKILTMS